MINIFKLSYENPRDYYTIVFEDEESEMFIIQGGKTKLIIHDIWIENVEFEIQLFGLGMFYLNKVSFLDSESISYSELVETFYSFHS